MGKKHKDGKDGKKAKKKKSHEAVSGAGLAGAVVNAARSMRTVLSRNLLATGLYAGQDGVILALSDEGGLTAGALAARLGVKAPTMTRTIGRLEAQGFVERRPDETDGRLTVVHLTEAGRASVDRITEAGRLSEQQAAEGLSEKDVRNLLKLLRAMDENLHVTLPDAPRSSEKTVADEI
ncbi:MarR family winged helix-turn-helix transcriptional regulator [Shinella zoogloeoides]|uniref:MarR family winged helix-turn-helix transcriptional regulator n=1 Tax=Shinella zoogloeoides TaxID=352475 RepID=UPI00273DC9A7|nr:MarR family transcriptional regulator [Shinella zoogloeoides]WLR91825.1 MarR family transcriptional regulator [Shinella zoogloeoides]